MLRILQRNRSVSIYIDHYLWCTQRWDIWPDCLIRLRRLKKHSVGRKNMYLTLNSISSFAKMSIHCAIQSFEVRLVHIQFLWYLSSPSIPEAEFSVYLGNCWSHSFSFNSFSGIYFFFIVLISIWSEEKDWLIIFLVVLKID